MNSPRLARLALILFLLLLGAPPGLPATPTTLRQDNPRVGNVPKAVENLKHHGEPLAFSAQDSPILLSGSPTTSHYQGIVRVPGPGVPYLMLSSSVNTGDKMGTLLTVRMGSRDRDGERLRSNRLEKDESARVTPPPAEDKVTAYKKFRWEHLGGMQACGDILVLPLEDPTFTTTTQGRIAFLDIRDPEAPVEFLTSITSTEHKFGVAGLIRLPDQHFLVAATWGENESVEFYRSTHTNFNQGQLGWTLVDTWESSELKGGYKWPTGKTSHQMLNFVLQEDGRLFLLGARNTFATTPFLIGEDELFLYEVTGFQAGSTKITLTQSSEARHLYCRNAETGFADFLAGIGVYVSPLGELIVYASEHYNWGPGSSVRFIEFRNRDVFNPDSNAYRAQAGVTQDEYTIEEGTEIQLDASPSRGPLIRPWIELYDEDDFEGESLVMDHADRFQDDFQDLRKMSFNDRASSLRYWAPRGWKIVLYDDDNFKTDGGSLTLEGGFGVQTIANLSDSPWKFDNGDLININETRVTSVSIVAPPIQDNYLLKPLTYQWSVVNGPADAVKVEPTGVKPRLLAVDGPADVGIQLTIQGPGTAVDNLAVRVINVAPRVTQLRQQQPPVPNGRAELSLRFVDPGTADRHSLRIVWGDGTEEVIEIRRGARLFNAQHQFPAATNPLQLWTGSFSLKDSDGSEAIGQLQFRPWTSLQSPVDTDQDGVPDGWELASLGRITGDTQEDDDADGVPNLAEFIRGGDPSTPDAEKLSLAGNPGAYRVSFVAARGDAGLLGNRKRYYSVRQSSNLVDWVVVPAGKDIPGADQVETIQVPSASSAGFFRLDVEAR